MEDNVKYFQVNLKLKEGAKPHIYVDELKKLLMKDDSLHPEMKKTLQLMKKARQPYVMLANRREIVFDTIGFKHFDRAVEPQETGWKKTYWCNEEIEQYKTKPKEYIQRVLKMFQDMNYEFFDFEERSETFIQDLDELTIKQVKVEE